MNKKKRMFLIDGSAMAHRSYWAFINNPLTTSKGIPTGAVYGFVNSLLKILNDEKPDYIAAIFDSRKPTFRHNIYKEYKATREKMPDELSEQIPLIFDVLDGFNIRMFQIDGYEADDVIATLSKKGEKEGFLTYLVTSDKDFMQLINQNIFMYKPTGKTGEAEIIDADKVKEKYGVPPEKIVDLFALMGDTSDNVPGIPGIGEKTAVKLLNEIGEFKEIIDNPSSIKSKSVSKKVEENKEKAVLSRELVLLHSNVPIDIDINNLKRVEKDNQKLKELFVELEFHSLMDIIDKNDVKKNDEERSYRLIKNLQDFNELIENIKKCKSTLVIDVETTSSDPLKSELVGISFSYKEKEAYYLPIQVKNGQKGTFNWDNVKEQLKDILESEDIAKCGHNIKFDMEVLDKYGIKVKPVNFDTMIASYLLNPSTHQHNLNTVSLEHLNYKKIQIEELIGSGKNQKNMREVPIDKIYIYGCEDSDITLRLKNKLEILIEEKNLKPLMENIELPLINVLIDMEKAGVAIDIEFLSDMSERLSEEIADLEKQIQYEAGEIFNINSPQQLGNVLFGRLKIHEQMGIKRVPRTKIGYKTDIRILENFSANPLVAKILRYRQLNKLKNTYVDALPRLINEKTGKVHTSFNQTVTATGRLSSTNPNLQNIPIRTDIGRNIRKAFIPSSEDNLILSADYSQVELRLLAHLSGDKTLLEAFKNDEDIHRKTASLIFEIPPEEVTDEMRYKAKSINFGIIYGMGSYKLSTELKTTPEEARNFIDSYFNNYPEVNRYIFDQLSIAKEKEYVKTLLGRIRYIPEINSKNARVRKNAENIAINTPIQGTAADMIKIAMIRINKKLNKNQLKTQMIIQIHDELVFDVPSDELGKVKKIVKDEMESALKLKLPIKVDLGWGKNWFEAH